PRSKARYNQCYFSGYGPLESLRWRQLTMKAMKSLMRKQLSVVAVLSLATTLLLAQPGTQPQRPATYPALPSETPATLEPVTDSFDYIKRDVMIAMRDGVKLHTVILVPKGARSAPILLT